VSSVPPAIRWDGERLALLDQRELPESVGYLDIETLDQAIDAIRTLAVRGAPAIGIAAAYSLALSVRDEPGGRFHDHLLENAERLIAARPTAVNLAWAVNRLIHASEISEASEQADGRALLIREAERIHNEDRASCRAIGEAGRPLIRSGSRILTHCNAGALAVSELGTATAPMYLCHQAGIRFSVYADETRPLLQGARLTAWELDQAGIDVTILCDSAAASLMASGEIDLVMVGTDRITANGDVINKIGTLSLAVLCNYFDVPLYVACPTSTFDPDTETGADVVIEMRDSAEVLGPHSASVPAYNPAFDVTPASLVTGLITDRGLVSYPSSKPLAAHFGGSK